MCAFVQPRKRCLKLRKGRLHLRDLHKSGKSGCIVLQRTLQVTAFERLLLCSQVQSRPLCTCIRMRRKSWILRFVCVLGLSLRDFAFSSVGVFTDVTKRAHIFANSYFCVLVPTISATSFLRACVASRIPVNSCLVCLMAVRANVIAFRAFKTACARCPSRFIWSLKIWVEIQSHCTTWSGAAMAKELGTRNGFVNHGSLELCPWTLWRIGVYGIS